MLLEIDTLDERQKGKWKPLKDLVHSRPQDLFEKRSISELDKVLSLWQQSFEWSFYDQVLTGIQIEKVNIAAIKHKSFQAAFCIDDRECSIRRYIEMEDMNAETFGTPGFFGVEFFFKPQGGKFSTKVCPAPVTPKYMIKEIGVRNKVETDIHFSKHAHNFVLGWLLSQTIGFWSAFKLLVNIFKPTMSPATASSLKHMDKNSRLIIENKDPEYREDDLQVGFTIDEMTIRVENVLKSIGLIHDFAPIVYMIGHGASSTNNPHYAAYDCGACSGRAGSVNARVFSYMANHSQVRSILKEKGIDIPVHTQFVGAIRDTTRDEIVFFDTEVLYPDNASLHQKNLLVFKTALDKNAKERSRRFDSVNSKQSAQKIHKKILDRSVSLFEPRPELNHATNAMCIVGRRALSKGVFLDRRAFLNSYDYRIDPDGKYLLNILNAAAPVCGGINLEYYFSRVDNQKLGAGTKLPHNVMGLFGVSNGIDGDLRPGLPSQMIEVHDPIRLLMIVEHHPDVVLQTIQKNPATYEWFINEWVILVVVEPETKEFFLFEKGNFRPYQTVHKSLDTVKNIEKLVESHQENFPVFLIEQA
ncbi:MAG: Na-translocating system protein MpsB [Phycisphaerales bacterium]|nr:Na-translocating system protein MpsB [Phycisphaerales bacterium]